MKDNKFRKNKKSESGSPETNGVGRRDLMKMGIGAGVVGISQMLHPSAASAQAKDGQDALSQQERALALQRDGGSKPVPGGPPYISSHTPTRRVAKYGYKNDSGRISGNGPMDDTSREIVSYVKSFSVDVTEQMMKDMSVMLLDTIGCGISAFETDSIRAGARVAKLASPAGDFKSTVWGYGIPTTPELAGFVGACAVRHYDNNSAGMHETDIIPGILAVGEALHSSGAQVLEAMIVGWEVFASLLSAKYADGAPGDRGVWSTVDNHDHAPMMAMAAGKLMGLNEDQLANALSLSFVDHLALGIDHWEGPNSMSKSNHDAELVRSGIFAAVCARAGVTGPARPFEGAKGLMDVVTGPFTVKMPSGMINDDDGYPTRVRPPNDNRYIAQTIVCKRYPGNGGVTIAQIVPAFKKFTKVEDIESIEIQTKSFGDGCDDGKWDPLNSETADHSLAYCFARLMLDGDLFLDAYEMKAMKDPAVRQLLAKMTIREVPDIKKQTITIRKKTGEVMTQESGSRELMTLDEINKKFDRNCAYRGVTNEQRDKIRATWADIRSVKDIGVPIRESLARIGKITPL